MYEENDYTVDAICPACGNEFECHQRDMNAEQPPCCCAECEKEWAIEFSNRWREWESERAYQCGYDYACGYVD